MRLHFGCKLRQAGFDFPGIVLDLLEFVRVEDPYSENIVEIGVYGSGVEFVHFGQNVLESLSRGSFAEFLSESGHCIVECFVLIVERRSGDDVSTVRGVCFDPDFSRFEENGSGAGLVPVGQGNHLRCGDAPFQRNGRVGADYARGEHRVVGSIQIDRIARRQFVVTRDGVVCASAAAQCGSGERCDQQFFHVGRWF